MRAAESKLAEFGAARVKLSVAVGNDAIGFYERLGYTSRQQLMYRELAQLQPVRGTPKGRL